MNKKINRDYVDQVMIILRETLEAEDLNNEGNIGNITQPRQITLSDGTVRQAISGDMNKHIFTNNLRKLASDDELCSSCVLFSPMKNGKVKITDDNLSDTGNRVRECIVDDAAGFMNAGGGRNEKRESIVKFSTAISTEEIEPELWVHSRNTAITEENKSKKKDKIINATSDEEKSNVNITDGNSISEQTTQMIFYKPIRCNQYALSIQVDLHRIGTDEERGIYAIDDNVIKERQRKIIKAITNTILNTEGANCNTQLPHLRNIEGVIVRKTDKNDVLTKYSSLNDDYKEVNKEIGTNVIEFENIVEFNNVMQNLV